LPSRHVVLDRSGAVSGHIVVASAATPWQDYPPDFIETRAEEGSLRHSLTQLAPLGGFVCGLLGTCP
jgi:hypothetical protein